MSPAPNHRAEHVFRLMERLRLSWLLAHLPPTFVWAAYVALNSFVTIALLTLLALLSRNPFVFPSLGPTAYLFFFSPHGGIRLSSECRAWTFDRAPLRLRGLSDHRHARRFRKGSVVRSIGHAFSHPRLRSRTYRSDHGPAARQSSAGRCDHNDRFTWESSRNLNIS